MYYVLYWQREFLSYVGEGEEVCLFGLFTFLVLASCTL